MDKNRLPIPMDHAERIWGIRWLLFELVFLSSLISLVLYALYPRYSDALLNLLYFSANFLAVLWIFRRYLRASAACLPRDLPRICLCTVGGLILYWLLVLGLDAGIGLAFPEHFNVNDAGIGSISRDHFLPMAIGIVLLAPVAEELLYRGLIFGMLHQRSRILAYTVSILIFCLIHVHGYIGLYPFSLLAISFLQYIPGGLVLALAYEKSGNIFCPILIHMAINAIGISTMR